jgi:hypothetical protein
MIYGGFYSLYGGPTPWVGEWRGAASLAACLKQSDEPTSVSLRAAAEFVTYNANANTATVTGYTDAWLDSLGWWV